VSFKGQGVYEDPTINVDGIASKVSGYITDILNEHALKFVKARRDKPFVLYLGHKAVHGPFTPAERHKDLYADDAIKPIPSLNDTLEGKPVATRDLSTEEQNPKKKNKKKAADAEKGRHMPEGTIRNQLRALAGIDE